MGYTKKPKQLIFIFLLLLMSGVSVYLYLTKALNNNVLPTDEVKGNIAIDCDIIQSKVTDTLDSAYTSRKWYIKDENLDSNYTKLLIIIKNTDISKEELELVEFVYEISDLDKSGFFNYYIEEDIWMASIDLKDSEVGAYEAEVFSTIKDCKYDYSKILTFNLSYPVYVTWSMDWEGFDVEQKYLDSMANISDSHGIPITHFFNPYIYMHIGEDRAQYLTDWVLMRETFGDTIGLHLHMYNDMVEATGVAVNKSITWGSWAGNGHDVPNSAYGYSDYKRIILWAMEQFEKNNLPKPDMYRAGGWYIDEENLKVLDDLGFILDSSGRTSYALGDNKLEGHWNLSNTTQPYQLNSTDQNIIDNPNMDLWEIPNNANDSWAFSAEQMISYFNENYSGGISKDTSVITFLSHPHWFDVDEPKMEEVFNYTDNYNLNSDTGPVIYTTLDKLPMLSENM